MKRGAGGFTELVAVIPGEVIAALEAVMAGNLMHGVAANAVLHLLGAESVLHLSRICLSNAIGPVPKVLRLW